MLNNRELASVVLLGSFLLVVCVRYPDVRSSVGRVLQGVFARKLLVIWALYAGVIAGAVMGERRAGLDYRGSVKDAVVWAVIAGLPLLARFDAVSNDPTLLGGMLLNAVKVTTLVEAFVNLYVFPFWVELLGQAVLAVVVMTTVVAGMEEANRPVKRLLDGLLGVVGLFVIAWTAWHLASSWSRLDLRATGLSFVQPVLLTIAAVALTAVLSLVSAYELAFLRLHYPSSAPDVRWRHRVALLAGLHARVVKVSRFAGAPAQRLREAPSLGEALAAVRAYRRGHGTRTNCLGMDDDLSCSHDSGA